MWLFPVVDCCRSRWTRLSCLCFFKQKTAYEMRISDWSSDVCSSDLLFHAGTEWRNRKLLATGGRVLDITGIGKTVKQAQKKERKSAGKGKSVSVRVDLGGRRLIKKKNNKSLRINTRVPEQVTSQTT